MTASLDFPLEPGSKRYKADAACNCTDPEVEPEPSTSNGLKLCQAGDRLAVDFQLPQDGLAPGLLVKARPRCARGLHDRPCAFHFRVRVEVEELDRRMPDKDSEAGELAPGCRGVPGRQ